MSHSRDAISLLATLFAHSLLELDVPERQSESQAWTSASSSRDIAFYDETLHPRLRLSLPPTAAIPPPQRGRAAYALPIAVDESEDDDWEERTEQARSVRLALYVLLSNLHLELRGSYVSPRTAPTQGSARVPETLANVPPSASVSVPHHSRPLPALQPKDAAYSEPAPPGDDVVFFATNWLGNKSPPASTKRTEDRTSNTDRGGIRESGRTREHTDRGTALNGPVDPATAFANWDEQENRWVIEWQASVPVGA